GGRTGLSGGAVAANAEAVVSFERMKKIISFSEVDQLVHLQAGVITKDLQDFAEDKSLYFPIEFASTGSSQIGGNIATNAGGIHVLKYGNMRNWVAGLKVVMGSGEA
ncbi:MAG: FAD-binding oxidoreductase, partial [Bdellovibrionales bacterium]|nr:FAD-binding oxidoreductase [Bdellovibrionales bacterium]